MSAAILGGSGFQARKNSVGPRPVDRVPDFLVKFESVNEPCPPGGFEETVCGAESDAIEVVQRLIEAGRTTPGRVRIYANVQALVQTSVTFQPTRPGR